jgi:hypothetical protein
LEVRTMPRGTVLVTILATLLLLGACGPADDGGTAFGEAELDQAVTDVTTDLEELGVSFEGELALAALASFPGFYVVAPDPVPPPVDGTLSLRHVRPSQAASLPRGIRAWDGDTFTWVEVAPSDDLVLRWSFLDAEEAEHDAEMVVDWGETDQVSDFEGFGFEVPTAMNVTLTVDATLEVGSVDAEFDWYSASACPGGILEPVRVYVDGSLGVGATLLLDAISFEIAPATGANAQMAFAGRVVASAGADSAGLQWDVTVNGPLTREPNCFFRNFEPESGAVDVRLFSTKASDTSSFHLALTFDNFVWNDPAGNSVDLDGDLTVDGSGVVSFSGTLDDEDADGIPGDNLDLVFPNGDTTTLEAFIESRIETTAATAMRVLSLFR